MMIMCDILRSKIESDRITDFVAIGYFKNEDNSDHAAFIIQHNNSMFEYHFTGRELVYLDLELDFFHKITNTIATEEVPSFIAHCLNIYKNANPLYGYFYSGESYDMDGNHKSKNDLGERMTCVGFCLNVLKGFLEDDYIDYSEWSNEINREPGYFENYCLKNGLDPDKISSYQRRITPIECLTTGFFKQLPIKKKQIDEKLEEVKEYLAIRYQTMSN